MGIQDKIAQVKAEVTDRPTIEKALGEIQSVLASITDEVIATAQMKQPLLVTVLELVAKLAAVQAAHVDATEAGTAPAAVGAPSPAQAAADSLAAPDAPPQAAIDAAKKILADAGVK